MTGCRTSSASSTRSSVLLLLAALVAGGCEAQRAPVLLPAPGGAVPLSIDGELRMRDLDALASQCVELARDEGHLAEGARVALLVPGGDADAAATSLTFAAALREAGYLVRRTHRRRLEATEMLVEISPVADGATQLAGRKLRGWGIEVEVRLFRKSDEPAFVSKRLIAESTAPLPE
ncbi:MAG: hypothetical protein ACAI25_07515 [Planctomycetota bacterium]